MTNTQFKQVLEKAQKYRADWEAFKFPIKHVSRGRINAGYSTYALAKDGMTYLLSKLENSIITKQFPTIRQARRELRYLYSHNPAQFVDEINVFRAVQEQDNPKRKNDSFLAALYKNSLWGLMVDYNPVPHVKVLETVQEYNLENELHFFTYHPKQMDLHFKYDSRGDKNFGMTIRNGETGHVAYSYHTYLQSGDFVFTFPLDQSRRHRGLVGLARRDLRKVLALCEDIKLFDYLETTLADKVVNELLKIKKYDKLHELFIENRYQTLDTLFKRILRLTHKRGFITPAKQSAEHLLKLVYKEL